MAEIDKSRTFVPLKIAVLVVSDTRSLEDDKSGALLVERIEKAGHSVAAREIVADDIEGIRTNYMRLSPSTAERVVSFWRARETA